jgi:hypothetical protein
MWNSGWAFARGKEIVPPRRLGGKVEIFPQPLDVIGGVYLASGTDDCRLDRDSGLRDLLGRHGTQRKHVLDARDDGIAVGIANESASRSALAQGYQARNLERSKSFPKRISWYAELDRKLALGRQTIIGLFFASTPKFTAQAVRKAYEINWKPLKIVITASSQIDATLKRAGLEASTTPNLSTPDYLPEVHYHQVRDAWHGVRTPSGK